MELIERSRDEGRRRLDVDAMDCRRLAGLRSDRERQLREAEDDD